MDIIKQLQEELQLGSSYFFCALWEKYYYPQFPAIKAQNTILHLGAIHGPDIDRAAYNTNDSSKYCYAVAEGDLWDYFYPVAPGSVVDFTDPALSDVASGLEYVQSNEHGATVIPVKDMATLASVDKGIHNKTTKYGLPTY